MQNDVWRAQAAVKRIEKLIEQHGPDLNAALMGRRAELAQALLASHDRRAQARRDKLLKKLEDEKLAEPAAETEAA